MRMKYRARHHVKIYALIFIVNFIYYLKKITYNIFKNTNNALLIIVNIIKRIKIHLNYDAKMFFKL